MSKPEHASEISAIEAEVDAVIAACDGDPRAAIRGLLIMQSYYEAEIDRLDDAVSRGFTRSGPTPAAGRKL